LKELIISNNDMTILDDTLQNCTHLTLLHATDMHIGMLDAVASLPSLRSLILKSNSITFLNSSFYELPTLDYLDLRNNMIGKLPNINNSGLSQLNLARNSIMDIPDTFNFPNMTDLDLGMNLIEFFPLEALNKCPNLQELNLRVNSLLFLIKDPNTTVHHTALRRLVLNNNSLVSIPYFVNRTNFPNLTNLNFAHNSVINISVETMNLLSSMNVSISDYEYNRLKCDQIKTFVDEKECALSHNDNYSFELGISIICISGGIILICVPLYFYVLKLKRKIAEEAQARMYNLTERGAQDGTLGVSVSPSRITFGSDSVQLPVQHECKDVLFLKGIRNHTQFRLVLPVVPTYKCLIDAAITQGEVSKGDEIGIELSITMKCTTSLHIPLLVVTEQGYATVFIDVESQLSSRLDAEEVDLGSVVDVGAYGTVYRGSWRGVDVAVKVYKESVLEELAKRVDFDRDVEICFKLRMPYIVSFYGRTVTPEKTYVVLETVPYGSLAKVMTKRRFSLRYKTRLALDIARGMYYLHRNRVIHRDLKPENVLVASVDPDSCVCAKLSIFNTSRLMNADSSSVKNREGNSLIFTAPEVHEGKGFSDASDVYSFALTIWSIWVQKEPYADQKSSLAIQLIINGERLAIPSDISDSLATLTRDCWAQKREDRPKMSSVVERLDKIFSELPPDDSNSAFVTTTTTTPSAAAAATAAAATAAASSADQSSSNPPK